MSTQLRMTPGGKGVILLVMIGIAAFAYYQFHNKYTKNGILSSPFAKEKVIKVGVVTWGGYAGGEYFNGGFTASKESRYYKDYGILVEFKVIDDFNASRAAFKSGDIDILWQTADAFPTEVNGLAEFKPRIIFQSDWSRGGDAIVVRRGITTINDLKGKKIAVATMTPSHTFLLNMLSSSGMSIKDVDLVKVSNAIDAADLFKKNQVDAAIVWSPDDQACTAAIEGSKILLSTKSAKNIIADIFFAKEDFLNKNHKEVKGLIEGWLKGASEINKSEANKWIAAKILAKGLSQPDSFCYNAINNARLCTYGDNYNFFNLSGQYKGVTGDDLFSKMTTAYTEAGFVTGKVPLWREISDLSYVREINTLSGPDDIAEGSATFEKNAADIKAPAVAAKRVTISFPTASFTLSDEAKYTIDKEFIDVAKGFSGLKIRIEGNTDNAGNPISNKALSKKRAQSVADYLINQYHFDPNRFVVIGNGSDNPVDDNNTDEGRAKNRRTDFELIPQ